MTTVNELLFFDSKPDALALYEVFREAVLEKVPNARIEVKKTQISFFNRRMFAAVSFAPVRKAKDRPKSFLTITFGLAYRKESLGWHTGRNRTGSTLRWKLILIGGRIT